jgi:hypothetical protein
MITIGIFIEEWAGIRHERRRSKALSETLMAPDREDSAPPRIQEAVNASYPSLFYEISGIWGDF